MEGVQLTMMTMALSITLVLSVSGFWGRGRVALRSLRDKQSIGKVGRGFLGLCSLEIQTQCTGCDGAMNDGGQQICWASQ
jgi:hypothetical protein